MRVTNRMMTTNMLNNINRNKSNVDILGYQYATQNKIQTPSDDPVVAVRSLKFRTQISEISQYLDKNIKDAKSWMSVTEDAMKEMNTILESISTYCTSGATDTLETSDRNKIIETLNQYKKQIYQQANSDYAGRYLFTGFRTDKPLLFDKVSLKEQQINNKVYTIKENLSFGDINSKSFVKGGASYTNPGVSGDDYAKDAATLESASRLQLSYGNLDKGPSSTVSAGGADFTRDTGLRELTFTDPKNPANQITLPDGGASGYTFTTKSSTEGTQGDCYTPGDKEIIFVPETGELIFGKDAFSMAQKHSDIGVEYTKSEFAEEDIVPEHYFECSASSIVVNTGGAGFREETVQYTTPKTQKIDYEINFSQKLTVNTLASDAVTTAIATKIDEIIRNVNQVFDMDDKLSEVAKLIETAPSDAEKANLKVLQEQLKTEQTLKKTILRQGFSSGITMAKGAQETLNVALANHGSRSLRLGLTESRLSNQKTSFTELLDENDKVELEDSVINYKQAQVVYEASLSCASTVISKTLLDYL